MTTLLAVVGVLALLCGGYAVIRASQDDSGSLLRRLGHRLREAVPIAYGALAGVLVGYAVLLLTVTLILVVFGGGLHLLELAVGQSSQFGLGAAPRLAATAGISIALGLPPALLAYAVGGRRYVAAYRRRHTVEAGQQDG